jgi:hypothetical protein
MKRANYLILFTAQMLITFAVAAQTPFMRHNSLFKGKEEYNVNIIYQDHKGWIWFGTDRGLLRFDGVNYKLFTTADSLASNNITSLHLAGDEKLPGMMESPSGDLILKRVSEIFLLLIYCLTVQGLFGTQPWEKVFSDGTGNTFQT